MKLYKYFLLIIFTTFVYVGTSLAQVSFKDIQAFIQKEQYKEALNLTNDHLSRNKPDIKFQFLKGLILTPLSQYVEAENLFLKMAADNQKSPEPLNNLAVIYAIQGKYLEAEETLKKALDTNTNYATAYSNLGDIYAKAASRAYNKALGLEESKVTNEEKLLLLDELILPETELIKSLEQENLELKKVVKDSEVSLQEKNRMITIKDRQLAKLGETQRSIQKLIQEKVELNVKTKDLKSTLDEVMYSLSLKDQQLAKLESTQKSLESLTEENKVLKSKLSQTEGSLGELNRSLSLKDQQLAKLESTQKSLESLTEENKVLKSKLSQTEGSLGELNRSLLLKDEQLAKLDKSLDKTMSNDLKKENNELKNKVKETELLIQELKKSVTFRKQGSGTDSQIADTAIKEEKPVSLTEKATIDAPKQLDRVKAVTDAITQWTNSWSSKDVNGYIESYAPEFKPSKGLSRNAWEKGRKKRLSSPTFIKITLSNMSFNFRGENLVKVSFEQEYQSDTYRDKVNKEITLKMINNKWLITRERVR